MPAEVIPLVIANTLVVHRMARRKWELLLLELLLAAEARGEACRCGRRTRLRQGRRLKEERCDTSFALRRRRNRNACGTAVAVGLHAC